MKKNLILTILFAMAVLNASAQHGSTGELVNLAQKFMLIKTKKPYAVMSYPVTYWDYYIITGKNIRPTYRSAVDVAPISGHEDRVKVAKKASQLYSGITVHVATASELHTALGLRYNISSENGPYSHATSGFYLAMDYDSYKKMKKLVSQYRSGTKPSKRRKPRKNTGGVG